MLFPNKRVKLMNGHPLAVDAVFNVIEASEQSLTVRRQLDNVDQRLLLPEFGVETSCRCGDKVVFSTSGIPCALSTFGIWSRSVD